MSQFTKLQAALLTHLDTPRGQHSPDLRWTRVSLDRRGYITVKDNKWVLTSAGRAAVRALPKSTKEA